MAVALLALLAPRASAGYAVGRHPVAPSAWHRHHGCGVRLAGAPDVRPSRELEVAVLGLG